MGNESKQNLKVKRNKLFISIVTVLSIFIIILIGLFIYYFIIDRQTTIPESIKNNTSHIKINVNKYMDRNVFEIQPKRDKKKGKYILYFHGGAYFEGATQEHFEFIENIAKDTGYTVIMPDYPLIPKYHYKDVFNMVEPLYKKIIEDISSENLILMGDSAGGGMALALLEKISTENNNMKMPSQTILISPWLDVKLENPEIKNKEKIDKQLNKNLLKIAGNFYSGNDGINNYLINPIDGDFSKIKNLNILTGTNDILNPDVHLLGKKARQINVDINIKEYENATHVWVIEKKCEKELVEQGYRDIISLINKV